MKVVIVRNPILLKSLQRHYLISFTMSIGSPNEPDEIFSLTKMIFELKSDVTGCGQSKSNIQRDY